MFPPWKATVFISAGVAIFCVGIAMVVPAALVHWVGGALIILGMFIIALGVAGYRRYLGNSYVFVNTLSGLVQRITWREYQDYWPEAARAWLKGNHRETYDALEKETSDRMGPPGRPLEKWEGESEWKYLRRLRFRQYIGVKIISMADWPFK